MFDLALMKRLILSDTEPDARTFAASDINGDGKVNVSDAVLLQQYLLAMTDEFPVGVYVEYEV